VIVERSDGRSDVRGENGPSTLGEEWSERQVVDLRGGKGDYGFRVQGSGFRVQVVDLSGAQGDLKTY